MPPFDHLIEELLYHRKLVFGDHSYRLVEIEFYRYDQEHPDAYTHCSKYQLKNGEFYFHRFGNGTPKEGTFKGMDICFGDETKEQYLGVLIRAIENLETGEVTEGPCRVVNLLLAQHNFSKCRELVEALKTLGGDKDKGTGFRAETNPYVRLEKMTLESRPIWVGPRIGLNETKYPEWRHKPYRIVTSPKVKKEKRKLQIVEDN